MPVGDFTAIDALWICLSVFLIVVGLALAFFLVRLAGSAARLTGLLKGLEEQVPPTIENVSGTIERVNTQLDKIDLVTTSAVDAADAADTAIRAVSMAITRPVQKVSGLAKGLSHGAAALWTGEDVRTAVAVGREAAVRREREVSEELARVDRRAPWRQAAASAASGTEEPPVEEPPAEEPSWLHAATQEGEEEELPPPAEPQPRP